MASPATRHDEGNPPSRRVRLLRLSIVYCLSRLEYVSPPETHRMPQICETATSEDWQAAS
jgi:hypothetical protein